MRVGPLSRAWVRRWWWFTTRGRRKQPLASIVLLWLEPPRLTAKVVREKAIAAWGTQLEDLSSEDFYVAGVAPVYVIGYQGAEYVWQSFKDKYFDDSLNLDVIKDATLRTGVYRHVAWLAIEVRDPQDLAEPHVHFRRIGKLAAAIANTQCAGIYCPQRRKLAACTSGVVTALASDQPHVAFEPLVDTMVEVDSRDAEIQAAEQEARRRWPEFESLYRARTAGQQFYVKVLFTKFNESESMWLAVDSLSDTKAGGTLRNDPKLLREMRRGQAVEVANADICDWMVKGVGVPRGGFTEAVLAQRRGGKV